MYYVMRGFSLFFSLSPRVLCHWIALTIAFVAFDLMRVRRKTILKNLRIALGDQKTPKQLIKIGRLSVYHFLMTSFEFLRSPTEDISGDIEVRGAEHLENALAKGQGLYCLCFHMGNWEAMCSKMSRTFVPSYVIVKKVGGEGMNRFIDEYRRGNDFHWIRRKGGKKGDGMRQIKEVLSEGKIVGFVIDQARPGEPRLPFFGVPAKTNTSFAAIWQKAKAPVVPGYLRRIAPGRHILTFEPEVAMQDSQDTSADIIENSTHFNQVVETIVRRHPEQYFWLHNRWKS